MAHRRVEVGESIRIRHGNHKGKHGVVTAHERRTYQVPNALYEPVYLKTQLTYTVEIEGVGPRRVPGSYLDLLPNSHIDEAYSG